MRALTRISKPRILVKKEHIWLSKILANPDSRPGTNTYRHKEIFEALMVTGNRKCFYCETKLNGLPSEIDHHIEVDIDRSLSVSWENLYLACTNCNNKLNHNQISVNAVLDPFRNSDIDIQKNLCFENEIILPKNGSGIGRQTILKYKLNSMNAEFLRMKELIKFNDVFQIILTRCVQEGRSPSSEETQKLKNFSLIENSYSLMFIQKLKAAGI
jgi:hypothetical protein